MSKYFGILWKTSEYFYFKILLWNTLRNTYTYTHVAYTRHKIKLELEYQRVFTPPKRIRTNTPVVLNNYRIPD